MKKFLGTAGAAVLLALTTTPAQAASPTTQATATAKIFRPLTIAFVQNLDFGTIVLSGAGAWAGEVVNLDAANALTCGGGTNLTCSGTHQPAKYHLVGTNNAAVTGSSPAFNLSGTATLPLTPSFTSSVVNVVAAAAIAGHDGAIRGSIALASTTPDGV